jgi:hypothetical protein
MSIPSKSDTVRTYVGDVQALVAHGLQVLAKQESRLRSKPHAEALEAVRECRNVLRHHRDALESRMKVIGPSAAAPLKDAVVRAAGRAAGLLNALRTEEASKSVRDDYTFLSHCAVAYMMLHTTATSLGDPVTADLAEKGYRDCARLIMTIDRIMPALVQEELREDGLPVEDVAHRVRAMVRDAWRRESGPAGVNA